MFKLNSITSILTVSINNNNTHVRVRSGYYRWYLRVTIGKHNHHLQDIGTNGDQY